MDLCLEIYCIILIIIAQQSTLSTNKEQIAPENCAVRKSYRATAQSAEMISLISDSYPGEKAWLPEHI